MCLSWNEIIIIITIKIYTMKWQPLKGGGDTYCKYFYRFYRKEDFYDLQLADLYNELLRENVIAYALPGSSYLKRTLLTRKAERVWKLPSLQMNPTPWIWSQTLVNAPYIISIRRSFASLWAPVFSHSLHRRTS